MEPKSLHPTLRTTCHLQVLGNRAPHVRTKDGSSLFDHFGKGFTLISLDDEINSDTLAAAAKERGIPFKVLTTSGSDREALLELYQARALLSARITT